MADHFAEICSSTPRVPWTNDRRRSLDSFRVSSDLPRGVIPRPIVRAVLELPRHRNTGNGIHLHNYLLAGSPWRPVAHRFTARCSLASSFFKIPFFNRLFNVSSILLLRARLFHPPRLPFSFLRCSFIFSGTFLTFPPILRVSFEFGRLDRPERASKDISSRRDFKTRRLSSAIKNRSSSRLIRADCCFSSAQFWKETEEPESRSKDSITQPRLSSSGSSFNGISQP